jgi:hypothetical protein
MAVLEAGSGGSKEWFDEFSLTQFAEKAKGVAADVFVRMLEIHSDAVASERSVTLPT